MFVQVAATVILVALGAVDDLLPRTIFPSLDALALAGSRYTGSS